MDFIQSINVTAVYNFFHMFLSAIAMILLVSLLIIAHEFGHYIAAKAVGIRVDKFGFGLPIGPTLWSKKVGETELVLHAFLFGGYVSFPDDEEDCDLPQDSPKRLANKNAWQKALVFVAGVFFNVILAYILIFMTGFLWKQLPDNKYSIYFENFAPSAVESVKNSGIKKGDKIYTINGINVYYPITLSKFLLLSKEFDGFTSQETIDKKLQELKTLNPNIKDKIGVGTKIKLPPFTDEEAVNLTQDNILGLEKYISKEIALTDLQRELRNDINYQKSYVAKNEISLKDVAAAISDTKKPVNIVVERAGEKIALRPVYPNTLGLLGIEQILKEDYTETKTLKQLTLATIKYADDNLRLMGRALVKLFTGKVPVDNMNGIIAITKIGTEMIAYKGLFQGLLLTAVISLNLAIMNLLPIPALDGGHLLFLIIEKVTGKPINKKISEILVNGFFFLLLGLIIFICYNDIVAWITGKI
ncbi:RIP metalloprotease RseP [bacterium]|nr:RIP metalloprotease RseP [bacterium]